MQSGHPITPNNVNKPTDEERTSSIEQNKNVEDLINQAINIFNKDWEEIEKSISTLEKYISDYLWIIDEIPKIEIPSYCELLSIKHRVYTLLYMYKNSSDERNQFELFDLLIKISKFDTKDNTHLYNKGTQLLTYCKQKWLCENELVDVNNLQERQSICRTAIDCFKEVLKSTKNLESSKIMLHNTKNYLIEAVMHFIIYEIHLNENYTIDKTKFYNNYFSLKNYIYSDPAYSVSAYSVTVKINELKTLINLYFKVIFEQTDLKNIDSLYSGIINILENLLESQDEDLEDIKTYFLYIINSHYSIFSKNHALHLESQNYDINSEYHKLYLEYQNALKSENPENCRTVIFKINEILYIIKKNELKNDKFIEEIQINLPLFDVIIHLHLADLTREKEDIEKAINTLWTQNSTTNLIFDLDIFCKCQSMEIKIFETLPIIAYINENINLKLINDPNVNNKDIYFYLDNSLKSILEILTRQKFKNNETMYDDTISLSENMLIWFDNLEKNLLDNDYADDQQKRKDLFLFTESILELLEGQTSEIFLNIYITLMEKQVNNIKDILLYDNNENLTHLHKLGLFQIYVDRVNLQYAFELAVSHAIQNRDPIFLKEVVDLCKEPFSLSMDHAIVKCHVIYIAIKLNLDIQHELEKWEEYLSKNKGPDLNAYLLSHFIWPQYVNKDPIKLGEAYLALKDSLTFFDYFNNDENFKKKLKIHYNLFKADTKILQQCVENYSTIIYQKINNGEKVEIEIINKYITDHLWIIEEIPKVKTKQYEELLKIKYYLYSILYDNYKNSYDNLKLLFIISTFDAIDADQLYMKSVSAFTNCENRFLTKDTLSDVQLQSIKSICITAINDLRKALSLSNDIEFTENVLIALIRCITIYIICEFHFNENDIFKTIDKSLFYKNYINCLFQIRGREINSLLLIINYSCKCIFPPNLNNIKEINIEFQKIISELLIGKTDEEKKIKNDLLTCIELYSKFCELVKEFKKILNNNTEKKSEDFILKVNIFLEKEYREIALKINKVNNSKNLKKTDSQLKLLIDTQIKQFIDHLKDRSLYMDENAKLLLALLTKKDQDIENAKKAIYEYNYNKHSTINFNIFCKYKSLGIKLYEIIPYLENFEKTFEKKLEDSAIKDNEIYKHLIMYLLDTIFILMRQQLNDHLNYDDNESLSSNLLINFEKIKEEFYKNSGKKIDFLIVTEAILELLEDLGLKERCNDLYTSLTKQHLDNIKNLLDESETIHDVEDNYFLCKLYLEKGKSIPYDICEDQSYCLNVFKKISELIKSSNMAKGNEANTIIDDAIDRFPSEIQFIKIKLSLLEETFEAVNQVSSIDNKELTVSTLPEKLKKPNNKNEANSKEYKAYSDAYTILNNQLHLLIHWQTQYNNEEEKFEKLSKKNEEIKNLYDSIKQINIEKATLDDLINLKNDFKKFDKICNPITEQNKVVEFTIKSLQDAKIKFDDAFRECVTKEKTFKEFKASKAEATAAERKRQEEVAERKRQEEAVKKTEAAAAARKRQEEEAAIKRQKEEAAATERKRKEEEAARKRQEEAARKRAAARKRQEEAARKEEAAAVERKRQEEEAVRKRQEAAARKAEAAKKVEAAAKKAEAAARKRQEEEAVRKRQEEAARKRQEELAARKRQEEAARIAAEQEAARIAAEQEAARIAAEQEAARIAAEQEAAKIAAEQEAARIAAEQEAARIAAEQEAARIAAEQEAARIAAEQEAARIAAEQEAARIAAEQEAAKIAAEQEAARIVAEQEAARIAAEEAARIAAEEEAARIAAEEAEKESNIVIDILLNGAGTKINDEDLANIYKLHKALASLGIKLKIKGSFAARLAIFLYNPNNREIAKLFPIHDIDLVIPYHQNNNLNSIAEIRSKNSYVIVAKETEDFVNVKRAKPNNDVGIDLDLTVEKSSNTGKDKFIPFHFLHLEIIEKDEYKEDDDKIIQIGDYYFKLCIEEGKEKIVENACKFAEFLVCKPEEQFNYYSYNIFKYLVKLSNCTTNNMYTSNASIIESNSNLLSVDNIHNPLLDYYINKLQSQNVKICYEEMRRFAIGIPEGKQDLAHPFIQDFYFALLLNLLGFPGNEAQNQGDLPKTFKKLYEFSSDCANQFINNADIVKNARDPQYDFAKWKKTIDEIAIKKFNEYMEIEAQGYKVQLAQDQLIQRQQFEFLLQQQQVYTQYLLQTQQNVFNQQRVFQPLPIYSPPQQAPHLIHQPLPPYSQRQAYFTRQQPGLQGYQQLHQYTQSVVYSPPQPLGQAQQSQLSFGQMGSLSQNPNALYGYNQQSASPYSSPQQTSSNRGRQTDNKNKVSQGRGHNRK